jgi:hypothetical protein
VKSFEVTSCEHMEKRNNWVLLQFWKRKTKDFEQVSLPKVIGNDILRD